MNPTTNILEERIASIEGGCAALCVSSGQAATTIAIQNLCNAGDNIIASTDLYGGTINLFNNTLKSIGIENLIVDLPSIDKYDDGGKLGNHRIFWGVDKGPLNQNTITELTYIKNQIEDGEYLLSLNMLNLNLDASPSRPIIYKVLK